MHMRSLFHRQPKQSSGADASRRKSVRSPRLSKAVSTVSRRVTGPVLAHPKLKTGRDRIALVWGRLVEAFCETIDPALARVIADRRLVATVTATDEIDLHAVSRGRASSMGLMTALDFATTATLQQTRWTAVELRLRSDQTFHRTFVLPRASQDFLRPIIDNKLERLTPWPRDRVLYGYRIDDAAEQPGNLAVHFSATSNDIIAAPLRLLSASGLVPTAIGVHDGPVETGLPIDFFGGRSGSPLPNSRRLVSRVALATLGFLAISSLATTAWAWMNLDRLDTSTRELGKARLLLKRATAGKLADREAMLLSAKRPDSAIIVLIDAIASAIPQDTYLKELSLTPDKLRLAGLSANPSALVAKLEIRGLSNARFTAATTRDKDLKDHFEITADRLGTPSADKP
jgi:general secretion pathway protein L